MDVSKLVEIHKDLFNWLQKNHFIVLNKYFYQSKEFEIVMNNFAELLESNNIDPQKLTELWNFFSWVAVKIINDCRTTNNYGIIITSKKCYERFNFPEYFRIMVRFQEIIQGIQDEQTGIIFIKKIKKVDKIPGQQYTE